MRKVFNHTYDDITSIDNLLCAWKEFKHGKTKKKDVQEFEMALMDNILNLHKDLMEKTYKHGTYQHFVVCDPKHRDIHKASVRDRLLHHALYRKLYPFFDTTFIVDSYSCRNSKGTHKAMRRFDFFGRKVSRNHTRTCWVLKCDIRKFFANIDHEILIHILKRKIEDKNILELLEKIIESFSAEQPRSDLCNVDLHRCHLCNVKKGLPLGNLTSQLLVNIYMNEFDKYVKHELKMKYYIRYADDFVFFSDDEKSLEEVRQKVGDFLTQNLKLSLHPDKVFIKTLASGVDFLGWVHFPHHKVLRTATKRRMFRKVNEKKRDELFGVVGTWKRTQNS